MNMGVCRSFFVKRSPTVPPATDEKAAPATPSRNLETSTVWMFLATAAGIRKIRNRGKETR